MANNDGPLVSIETLVARETLNQLARFSASVGGSLNSAVSGALGFVSNKCFSGVTTVTLQVFTLNSLNSVTPAYWVITHVLRLWVAVGCTLT